MQNACMQSGYYAMSDPAEVQSSILRELGCVFFGQHIR